MARRYGFGSNSGRIHGAVFFRHRQSTTLLGTSALKGMRYTGTIEAATDTEVFCTFVERMIQQVQHTSLQRPRQAKSQQSHIGNK